MSGKKQWKIEVRTGDHEPHVEWLEVYDRRSGYRFVDREEAERALAVLRRVQPHAEFRVAPLH